MSSPGPVQLSLHSVLLLIKEATINTNASKLYIGELHKGPMLRKTTTFRNVEGDTSPLPACLLDVPTNFYQERPLNPLLPRGWKDSDELGTRQVLKSYF